MSSNTLSNMIRAAVIAVTLCGIAGCLYILPSTGTNLAVKNPGLAHCYYPWLIFLWIAAIPCFAILIVVWKVSSSVKQEAVFTYKTARRVKISAVLLFGDTCFFIAGNTVFLLLGMSHPFVLLISLFIAAFGVSLAILAATLSRFLTKAAVLQEEADSTI